MRKNCLYERSLGKWVQYSESAYEELHCERERVRKQATREGRCVIPWKKIWFCDGQCDGCPYQRVDSISLNTSVGESGDLVLEDVLVDRQALESIYVEKMDYEGILKRLDEVMPLARKIGLLRLEGKSDREIAKELGISRTSMYRMLDKAKAILREEFEEI
jgi:DNA-directed RNA polymerase specialized sigma24 family protein